MFGNQVYSTLASIKEDHAIKQIIGVHEIGTNSAEIIETIRKRVKDLELRDSIMLVFAN